MCIICAGGHRKISYPRRNSYTSVLARKNARPPRVPLVRRRGGFAWWKRDDFFRSRSSRFHAPLPPAKVRRYYLRYPAATSNGIPRCGDGFERARVSAGGEQRVTRGSILYRGRGPPLVARCFPLCAIAGYPLRMPGPEPKSSGDTPRICCGLLHPAFPLRSPRDLPPSSPPVSIPARVDFLRITARRATVGAPTFACVIMRKMLRYF